MLGEMPRDGWSGLRLRRMEMANKSGQQLWAPQLVLNNLLPGLGFVCEGGEQNNSRVPKSSLPESLRVTCNGILLTRPPRARARKMSEGSFPDGCGKRAAPAGRTRSSGLERDDRRAVPAM